MSLPPDASGRGWRDAHLHIFGHGEQHTCLSLGKCASLGECLDAMARHAGALPPGAWARGAGAHASLWPEGRLPTAKEIDAAVGGRPAFVRSFDLHSASASSAALALAGITRDTPDPTGGVVVRDSRGEPDGRLLESGAALLRAAIPAFTPQERERIVADAVRDLHGRGFVELHDMLAQAWLGPALAGLIDGGDADANAVRFLLYAPLEELEGARAASSGWERSNLRLAGGKVFLDGTLNSRTAWLLRDYAAPLPGMARGQSLFSDEGLCAAIARADDLGFPLAMHAIGDAAVRQALNAIERVRPRTPGWRIEHAQFVAPEDVARFARLRVVASPQPCQLPGDVEALRTRTPALLERAYPLRDLWDAYNAEGLNPAEWMWFGSDTPVVPPDVEANLIAASLRRGAGATVGETVGAAQALTRDQAIACSRPTPPRAA